MSRTHKDRPYWVLKNDPNMDRYAIHDHVVWLQELVGEEPAYRRIPTKDGWHWEDEFLYTRKLYKRWAVHVECTLDIPEISAHSWRLRTRTNDERLVQKNCHWWLEYYPNIRSSKDFKQLTNGAVRSKVRQQLHNAIRDNGRWTEYPAWEWYSDDYYNQEYPWPDYVNWDEVDIFEDSRYSSSCWWD